MIHRIIKVITMTLIVAVDAENVTTESFKISTVQNVNTDAEIQQGSHYKPDITLLVLMVAGPFVVFDIGLILFIYRKKLMSCSGGKHDAARMYTNENTSDAGRINKATDSKNASCSNCISHSRERVAPPDLTTGVNTEQISCVLNVDQQADTNFDECIDDDPLYSRVKGKATMRADTNTGPQREATPGRDDLSFGIPLDKDSLYSTVKDNIQMEPGICGFTLREEENTPADPIYIDIDNLDAHYATVKRDDRGNKQRRETLTFKENDDPHNSIVTNDVLQSTSSSPHNSVKLNCISSCGSHSGSKDDPFDSDVKKDNGIYSLAKNVDPLYSTVMKKKQICVTESSNVAFKDNYLYSVVDKKNKGKEKAWMTTVPPAPVCSISDVPPYSKVNKKKKKKVDADDSTEKTPV